VNALASVKNEIHNSIEKIKKNKNITQNYNEILKLKLSIMESVNKLFEIKLHAPFFAQKAKAGNVLKFQVFGKESIAITIAKIKEETLTLYLENSNSQTASFIKSIASGTKIHINGVNCSSFPEIPQNCTIVACEKARLVFGEIFKSHKIITPQQFIELSSVLVDYNKNKKEYAIARPSVIKVFDVYHMWYCYKQFNNEYKIGYATSNNGIDWKRIDKCIGLKTNDKKSWDSQMLAYPHVFKFKNNIYMLYNGNGYGMSGIGLAKLNQKI
jgi:hypothetical protein